MTQVAHIAAAAEAALRTVALAVLTSLVFGLFLFTVAAVSAA